ncbi:MAG: MarR family transcriptional regulator [Pseudonocardia sp.]|nr:MarR family transcriptional regulator [Pseudonocardia sp.]
MLARLGGREPVRQVDLAEPVLGDPPNVSRLVDALVAHGHVERAPDPADRRSVRLSLTDLGRARRTELLGLAAAERERVFDGFDGDELDRLVTALDRIDANVRRLLTDGPGFGQKQPRRGRR